MQQSLRLPSHPPGLEAAFPASLYLFGRHGRLCPEGAKILLRGCAQIAPALRRGSCAASSVNLKKDSAYPILAVERAILILHRRRPRRIAVRVHRKSGWNPERKRPLPFPAAAQRNGLFRCSFLHAAHSCLTRSAGTAHPANRKALFHQAQRRTLRKSWARTPIHASLHGQKNLAPPGDNILQALAWPRFGGLIGIAQRDGRYELPFAA